MFKLTIMVGAPTMGKSILIMVGVDTNAIKIRFRQGNFL